MNEGLGVAIILVLSLGAWMVYEMHNAPFMEDYENNEEEDTTDGTEEDQVKADY